MKTKNVILSLFAIAGLLTIQNVTAQQYIGDFNHKEDKIYSDLEERRKSLDTEYYKITAASRDYTAAELSQYIGKLQQLISNAEERLQQCQNALRTLPELSDEKITTNIEYKFWTEDLIKSYQFLINFLKARIKKAEDDISRLKSSERAKEVETKRKEEETIKQSAVAEEDKKAEEEQQKIKEREEYQKSQDEAIAAAKRTEEARKRAEEEAKQERQANYDAWKRDAQEQRQQQELASATASVGLLFLFGGIIYDNMSDVNPDHIYKGFEDGVKFYSGTEFGFGGTAMPIIFGSEYSTLIGGEYVTQNELKPSNVYTVNLDLKYKIGMEHKYGSAHAYIAPRAGFSPIFNASQISLLNYGGNVTAGLEWVKLYGDYSNGSRTFNSISYDPEEYGSGRTNHQYSRIKYGLRISTNADKSFIRSHFSFGMINETMTVADNIAYFDPNNMWLAFERKSEKIQGFFFEYKKDHNFNLFINLFPNYIYSGEITSDSGGLNSEFVSNTSGLYVEIGFLRVWDFWN